MVYYILITLFFLVMVVMIIVILLQRARGGGLVGALGAGGSETALGALGNKEMIKFTTYLAIAFFLLAVLLDFNPPERKSDAIDPALYSSGFIPRFDDEDEVVSDEEAPLEIGGGASPDEDLVGGALGSGDAPTGTDSGAGTP